MDKIVLFDIDYTLFDTELFRQKLYRAVKKALKVDSNVLDVAQKESIIDVRRETGYFNPELFSKLLAKNLNREKDEKIIFEALFNKENFKDNYYKEVRDILKKTSKIARIGIFSKGHHKLQREKLYEFKDILKSDDVHIATNKYKILLDVLDLYKKYRVYLVDDALDVLYEAKKLNKQIFTIWVKRGFYADKQENIKNWEPDAIISDLSKLLGIIKK